MARASKEKGKKGEREVVAILKQHFPGLFKRNTIGTANSDLIVPENFPYSVEVKNSKALRFQHLLFPTKELLEWWQQTEKQAKDEGKLPLLVVKVERVGWWCVDRPPKHWKGVRLDAYMSGPGWLAFESWCEAEAAVLEARRAA